MEQDKKKSASNETMAVWRHTPPIPCPVCGAPTVSTWDSSCRDKSNRLLALRGCPECDKKFTPFPELKEIPGLTLVQQGAGE